MGPATRGIIVTLALTLLAVPGAAGAPAAKVSRVGILWFGAPAAMSSSHLEAFRHGLRTLGYAEGQNLTLEYRSAARWLDLLSELAADLVLSKVDVIVAAGDPAINAAKQATSTIPIVMVASGDPVGSGLVASLARPGGNLTGLSALSPELIGKRLELLREAMPGASRVAILLNPADPANVLDLRAIQASARALDVQLQTLEVQGPDAFESAFAAMTKEGAEALMTLGGPLTVTYRLQVADLAAKHRLPAMYDLREFIEAGGLMAYGPSLPDMMRRAAAYVDKILQGTSPGDLPVQQPVKFELVINLKTAKALGLTLPPTLLFQADEVLQ